MEKNKIFIIVVLFMLLVTQVFAQGNKKVNGQVTDEKGLPLKEAFVTGDEGDVYTTTDKDGQFSIEVMLSDVILIEKEGYNSKQVSVKGLSKNIIIALSKPDYLMTENDMLQLPFRNLAKRRTTGSAIKIDVNEQRNYDASMGLNAALNGRVPGLFGSKDMWGRGDAIIVVDGVPRTDNYEVNLLEVESITVLKDPVSRSMYGAFGDKGVIMVKTKRGKAYKKVMNFQAESGVSRPIENTFPKFMNAADYLQTLRGLYPTDSAYSVRKIADTRNGVNPAINPNNNLYSSEFLQSQTEYQSFRAESSGGNKMAQYYLNVGWQHNNGWMKLGDRETTDKLNIRGNVDYQLSDNFKMNLDAGALVNIMKSSNISDYWKTASTVLPNAYPLNWDPASITNTLKRDSISKSAVLLPNGMLVGGNPNYPTNFYGDIFKKGAQVTYERNIQINVGAEWDLKFLLPGLKAKGYLALDAYNTLSKEQNGLYAVYNPTSIKSKLDGSDSIINVAVIGADKKVSNFATVGGEMYFHRRIAAYASLAYDKTFGKTDVSLLAVAYRDQLALKEAKQEQRNLTFGFNGNIMHANKYLLDFSLSLLGSQKLTPENRLTFAPSLGLGWILSEEGFLANNDVVNYLKLRSSAGIMKNDSWDNYWLHTSAYQGSGGFNYNNANNSNTVRTFTTLASDVNWQKRKELVLGFDASMFKNTLWLEGSVFYTQQYDMITELKNLTPLLAGTNSNKYWGNYDSDRIQGFDLGLKYNVKITNDFSMIVGSNIVVKAEKTLKQDEPNYTEAYQFRAGTATNSHWGLNSEGLYGADDFDVNGNLLSTLPIPAWGKVAPGDIKYVDTNNDGKINSTDVHIIGQQGANFQYSMYFNLKYKQFELYALGIGYLGGNSMRTGDYYRPYGNILKYPEHLKTAYSAANPDLNALYPRLTTSKSDHNNQTSDYWMYNGNSFSIPTIQFTYNYVGKPKAVVKDLKIYLKGSNLIRYNAKPTFANLSLGAPKTYSVSVGTIFSF